MESMASDSIESDPTDSLEAKRRRLQYEFTNIDRCAVVDTSICVVEYARLGRERCQSESHHLTKGFLDRLGWELLEHKLERISVFLPNKVCVVA